MVFCLFCFYQILCGKWRSKRCFFEHLDIALEILYAPKTVPVRGGRLAYRTYRKAFRGGGEEGVAQCSIQSVGIFCSACPPPEITKRLNAQLFAGVFITCCSQSQAQTRWLPGDGSPWVPSRRCLKYNQVTHIRIYTVLAIGTGGSCTD